MFVNPPYVTKKIRHLVLKMVVWYSGSGIGSSIDEVQTRLVVRWVMVRFASIQYHLGI